MVSANGRVAVSVLFDSSISVWDVDKMQVRDESCQVSKSDIHFAALRRGKDCPARPLPSWDCHASTVRHQLTDSLVCAQVKWVLQKRGERDASRVHSGGVNAALVTDDGKLAVTLSKDCTARVWDLRNGTCMHVLVGESSLCHVPACISWPVIMPMVADSSKGAGHSSDPRGSAVKHCEEFKWIAVY